MSQRENYDFCPKCGALMRNGVCTSCGYDAGQEENPYYQDYLKNNRGGRPEQPGQGQYGSPNQPWQGQYGRPNQPGMQGWQGYDQLKEQENGSGKTAIIIVAIVFVTLLVAGVMLACIAVTAGYREYVRTKEEAEEVQYMDPPMPAEEEKPYYEEPGRDVYGVTPDALYYEGLTECIDESVDYSFRHESFDYTEEEGAPYNTNITVDYIQLSGDNIPNLATINEQIEYYSLWLAKDYYEQYTASMGKDAQYYLNVRSYVTYNDERQASIVLDETLSMEASGFIDLVSINVDLMNGRVIDNDEVLNINDSFIEEFKERNARQNTSDLEGMDDEDLYNLLRDPDQLILFYTPMGLEVGFNYITNSGYSGWVTVTYKDYDRYLKQVG